MKILLILLAFPLLGFAQDCKVDGITDSPQKLKCRMQYGRKISPLKLSCVEGVYRLEWLGQEHEVSVAYHEEVESGSSPLVFVTDTFTVTTTSRRVYHGASMIIGQEKIKGICFKN